MIHIKTPAEQQIMRESCRRLAIVMEHVLALVKPGVMLLDLEQVALKQMAALNSKAAFRGYKGYQYALCTSINEEVVHCPPTKRRLLTGEILSIDVGLIYQNMYSDCAFTIPVGTISAKAHQLLTVTQAALMEQATAVIKPGNTIGDISQAIQLYVEQAGFSVVRSLVGHGIGHQLHEDPVIPNFGQAKRGAKLEAGMTIAVEPMVNSGGPDVIFDPAGWRVVTSDGSLSAHFEHTFLVTPEGCEILTAFNYPSL